jgi:hypothetical protein
MPSRPSAIAHYDRPADVLTLTAWRELKTPNAWLGAHWGSKNGERAQRKAWTGTLGNAIGPVRGLDLTTIRRRVTVTRLVPTSRHLIKDDDNLVGALKPLLDALVRLEYIRDDRREWLELVPPTQAVANDGAFRTIIEIAPARPLEPSRPVFPPNRVVREGQEERREQPAADLVELRRRVRALESVTWDRAEAFAGERLVSRADVLELLGARRRG